MNSKRITGTYETTSVAGVEVAAFLPHPLPPSDPVLEMGDRMRDQVRTAEEALRRLELAGEMVPSYKIVLTR